MRDGTRQPPSSALAWGPVHLTSAEQVQVEVRDGLAAFSADVDHDPVAFAEVLLAGQLVGDAVQMADEGLLLFAGSDFGERGDVLFGDDQDVNRRLRVKIRKGEGLVVFVELFGGNFSGGDFAEDAVHKQGKFIA
jgi:hypothetical protein